MSKNRRPKAKRRLHRNGSPCRQIGPVKIAGYRIQVRMVHDLKVNGNSALGAYRCVNPVILINKAVYGREKAHTVLHEALHAISRLHKIGLTERHVSALEVALGDLIVNNPKLVKALCVHEK